MALNSKIKRGDSAQPPVVVEASGGSGVNGIGVAITDGAGNLLKVTDNGDGTATLNTTGSGTSTVSPAAPSAANVLAGRQTFAATTAATTLLTVAAGRTWIGEVGASCSVEVDAASTAAGQANATFTTAGTGVVPTAGTYLVVDAKAGANGVAGLTGSQGNSFGKATMIVVAPAGNAVTIKVATTQAGTASLVEAFAFGQLI